MKNVFILISCILLLTSCSSDDNDSVDAIVGQWQMVERYESNIQTMVGCSQYYYVEFKSNNEIIAGYIDFENTPTECTSVVFEVVLWRKSGDVYEIYVDPNDVLSVAYFEGDDLVIESTFADWFGVYQRL